LPGLINFLHGAATQTAEQCRQLEQMALQGAQDAESRLPEGVPSLRETTLFAQHLVGHGQQLAQCMDQLYREMTHMADTAERTRNDSARLDTAAEQLLLVSQSLQRATALFHLEQGQAPS
jgi:hypothetical protein